MAKTINELREACLDKSLPLSERKEIWKKFQKARQKAQKLAEKVKLSHPHTFFEPNPPQYKFFKMLNDGVLQRKIYDYVCPFGNGTGKTTALALLIASLAWGEDCVCDHLQRFPLIKEFCKLFDGAPKTIRLGCESKQIREYTGAIYQAFNDWWPKDGSWKSLKQGYDYPTLFLLPNGWKVVVATFDQSDKSKESDEIVMAVFDEPPPLSDWFAAGPRMRHGGIRLIFATLCMDSEGIANEVMGQPTTEYFYADTRQNSTDYSEVIDGFTLTGKLSPIRIEEMIAKMRPEEREYRVSGRPIHLRGRAFDIDPAVHYLPASEIPKAGTTCVVVDPHPRKPYFITVLRQDCYRNIIAIDEWPKPSDFAGSWFHKIEKDTRGIGFFADHIKRLANKWKADFMVLDFRFANAQVREDEWAVSTLNKLRNDYDLEFEKGSTQVSGEGGAIRELQDALSYKDGTTPRLRIVRENCPNGAYMLENVCWKDDKEKLDPRMDDGARSYMYGIMAPWDTYNPVVIPKHESGRAWEEIDLENRWMARIEERRVGRHAHELEEAFA